MPNQVDAYGAITGDWSAPMSWADGDTPGSFTPIRDASIGAPGTYTLSVTNLQNAGSVTLSNATATLDVQAGGSLQLGGGVDPVHGTLDLADGTFSLAGTVGSSVASPLVILEGNAITTYSGGTFDNVQLEGTLDLSAVGASLFSSGGLQVINVAAGGTRGIINVTGDQALLTITTNETLSDVALALGGTTLATPTTPELAVGSGATLTVDGSSAVSLPGNATFSGSGGLVLRTGLLVTTVTPGGTLGLQTATTENDTTRDAGSGTINVTGALTGFGAIISSAAGGTIDLQSTADAAQTIRLSGGDTLILDDPSAANTSAVAAQITGLAANTIDLISVGFSSGLVGSVANGGVMTITDGATTEAILNTDIADGTLVAFSTDGGIGTNVNVACFCPDTAIRTPGGEVAVERLAIGDTVMTASGMTERVRWIGRRSYAGRFARGNKAVLPIRISAGALADGVPCRDLWLSPKHALLLDGVLIPAEVLVNGCSIVQVEEVDSVEYFHVELDRHDALIAEGAAAESFVDDHSRGMFHNAHEHAALYPDARRAPALYCAPRREDGEQVEAVRRRLARRADPAALSGHEGLGTLRGRLDMIVDGRLYGWAQHDARPEAPVCLELLLDDRVVAQVLANRYRSDLWDAGLGSGCHAFEVTVPDALQARTRSSGLQAVRLRRAADGAELSNPFGAVPDSTCQHAPERECAA